MVILLKAGKPLTGSHLRFEAGLRSRREPDLAGLPSADLVRI